MNCTFFLWGTEAAIDNLTKEQRQKSITTLFVSLYPNLLLGAVFTGIAIAGTSDLACLFTLATSIYPIQWIHVTCKDMQMTHFSG